MTLDLTKYKNQIHKLNDNYVLTEVALINAENLLSDLYNSTTNEETKAEIAIAIYAIRISTPKTK